MEILYLSPSLEELLALFSLCLGSRFYSSQSPTLENSFLSFSVTYTDRIEVLRERLVTYALFIIWKKQWAHVKSLNVHTRDSVPNNFQLIARRRSSVAHAVRPLSKVFSSVSTSSSLSIFTISFQHKTNVTIVKTVTEKRKSLSFSCISNSSFLTFSEDFLSVFHCISKRKCLWMSASH